MTADLEAMWKTVSIKGEYPGDAAILALADMINEQGGDHYQEAALRMAVAKGWWPVWRTDTDSWWAWPSESFAHETCPGIVARVCRSMTWKQDNGHERCGCGDIRLPALIARVGKAYVELTT